MSPLWPGHFSPRAPPPWMMGFWAPEGPLKSGAALAARCSVALPEVPQCLRQTSLNEWECTELGEASGVTMCVFLPIMVAARLHLPRLWNSTLSLGPATVCFSVPGAADSLPCSPVLAAAVSPRACSQLWEGVERQSLGGWGEAARLPDLTFCCPISVFHLCPGLCLDHWNSPTESSHYNLIPLLSLSSAVSAALSVLLSLFCSLVHLPSDALMCRSLRSVCVSGWESSVGL